MRLCCWRLAVMLEGRFVDVMWGGWICENYQKRKLILCFWDIKVMTIQTLQKDPDALRDRDKFNFLISIRFTPEIRVSLTLQT